VHDSPHSTVAAGHQHRLPINVRVGILPNRPAGAVYHRFLVNDLPVLLEHLSLLQHHMWLMQDGAPPYFIRTVRQQLNHFGELRIGRGAPVN
jgi:hypothetical protein